MVRELADEKRSEKIEQALQPPPWWRDRLTGLPAGFADEDDDWADWEAQMAD